MKMIQILLMLFLITIKCNKIVCVERANKINNVRRQNSVDVLNNSEVTNFIETHSQKLEIYGSLRETSFNDKNDVQKNHQTNSDINGNPTQRNAVPPVFLLPDNGSASNRSVSQVPIILLSIPKENVAQVSADLSVEFSNEFQPNLNHSNVRNRRGVSRQDICRNECVCRLENNFHTVDCKFSQDQLNILGPNKYIRRSATSLLITLKNPKSELRFEENFFYNNNINRILIECPADNRAQIELGTNAFVGNEGPFPEIDIVNCYAVLLRSNAFHGEFKLNITQSNLVMIFQNAFYGTTFHGHFERIADLSLHEKAFSNAEAKILIFKCKIDTLYRLDGRLKEIKFTNSEIKDISTGAFDAIEITSIVFENCSIGSIQMKATTDRLFTSYLEITGCSIETIETKAIDGSGISEVVLRNNRIVKIKENAIHLTTSTAVISNNTIHYLNTNWFKVKDWTNITISNNKFGDFNRIYVDRTANPVQCLFSNNFISKANKDSLNFSNTHCRIKDVFIDSVCKCSQFSDWLKELSSVDLRSETYCQVDDALRSCLNSSLVNVLKFENDICSESTKTLDCARKKVTKPIEGSFINPSDINERKIDVILISIIGGCSLLFILILIGIFVLVKKIYKSRPITIPLSDMTTPNNLGSMKQSKSFSNDDRDIINQTMEIIKEKQTAERYDQIYNNTKKLLGGNLTELDKVTTIGEIVRTLEECENTGSDFVAFTDILYKHLAPKDNNQNDPIYSEPNLHNPRNEDDEGNTFVRDDMHMGLDHIYAEPNSVQQPLLTNEYASPIDRNEQSNLYTEPVPNLFDKPRHIISPYAIATNLETTPANSLLYSQIKFSPNQPSTSKNLPDVLNPANSPHHQKTQLTHLTRSPTTHRKIPKYTIPSSKFKKTKNDQSSDQNQSSEESNSHSDHSGGSDITYKVDEVIEYADA